MQLVELIKRWADRKSATPAQIALAWLLAKKTYIVPIPGTTSMAHSRQNIGSVFVNFTADELAQLNAITIQGLRLPEPLLALSGLEAPEKVK